MARDPGSIWKPLPEAGAPDGRTKTQFIVHSTGTLASAAANWNYFARGDVVVESTFIVGLSSSDPTLQVMDSTDVADANGSANGRGISVEVVGDGTAGFTSWQRSELIRLGRWAKATHGIAPRVIPSEAASGFGWHVMFGAPGPWTTQRGKVCPGNVRIQQLKTDIFPAIFGGPVQEDDVHIQELIDFRIDGRNVWDSLKQILDNQVAQGATIKWPDGRVVSLAQQTADNAKAIAALSGQVAALLTAVKGMSGGGVDLAAVEVAAERGTEKALSGFEATVTIGNADQPTA